MTRLAEEACGVADLQRHLAIANRRVLVRALRQLEVDGLVQRTGSPDTAYCLTRSGVELAAILLQLADWQKRRRWAE